MPKIKVQTANKQEEKNEHKGVGKAFRLWIKNSIAQQQHPSLSAFDETLDPNEWMTEESSSNMTVESFEEDDEEDEPKNILPQCCDNIDDCMFGLYTLPSETSKPLIRDSVIYNSQQHEYDWILDGDLTVEEEEAWNSMQQEDDDWGDFHSASSYPHSFLKSRCSQSEEGSIETLPSPYKTWANFAAFPEIANDELKTPPYFSNYVDNLPDMSSAEGRFIRRVYAPGFEESQYNLNWENFCNENSDHDYLPELLNMYHNKKDASDEFLTLILSDLDAMKAFVEKKRNVIAFDRFQEILQCREIYQDIDMEIYKAEISSESAQQALQDYSCFVAGESEILQTLEKKDQMKLLRSYLVKVQSIIDLESKLAIDKYSSSYQLSEDINIILQTAIELKDQVKQVEGLKSLAGLQERMQNIFSSLCDDFLQKIKNLLKEAMQEKISLNELNKEYFMLVQARTLIEPNLKKEMLITDKIVPSDDVCAIILNTSILEVERGLADAIYNAVSTEKSYDWEMYQIQISTSVDNTSLRNISTALLVIQYALWEQAWHKIVYQMYAKCAKILYIYTQLENFNVPEKLSKSSCLEKFKHYQSDLATSRNRLWNYCESTLVFFLDQLLYLYKHTDSQTTTEWLEELNRMHILAKVIGLFIDMGNRFCIEEDVGELLKSKLREILKKFVRGIHVEAMNSMGSMLFKESWEIIEVHLASDNNPSSLSNNADIMKTIHEQFKKFSTSSDCDESFEKTLQHTDDNPFLHSIYKKTEARSIDFNYNIKMNSNQAALYNMLCLFTEKPSPGLTKIFAMCNSTLNGLVKWTARLCKAIEQLCPVCEKEVLSQADIEVIFSDVYDLYFLTILRLCAGSGAHEQILLECKDEMALLLSDDMDRIESMNNVSRPFSVSPVNDENKYKRSSGMNSQQRRHTFNTSRNKNEYSKHARISRIDTLFSPTTEADICSPAPDELRKIVSLRKYVKRAQNAIGSFVQLDKVEKWIPDVEQEMQIDPNNSTPTFQQQFSLKETTRALQKRIASAISCLYAAAVLDVASSIVNNLKLFTSSQNDSDNERITLKDLVSSVVQMAPHLATIAFRISCVRAIRGRRIVREILSVRLSWEGESLTNVANDYVELLCDGCAAIWGSFSLGENGMQCLPHVIQNLIWENIVRSSFLSMLHGFSQILRCSTEGRALMGMDLVTFAAALEAHSVMQRVKHTFNCRFDVPSPPTISIQNDMKYVDLYVKVFYFDEKDIMTWIAENYGRYRLSHTLALITCGVGGRSTNRNISVLIMQVKELYSMKLSGELSNLV